MYFLNDPSFLMLQCYFDGRFVGTGELDVFNPANGMLVGKVLNEGATRAVEAASSAFAPWSRQTAKDRSSVLRKWFDFIIANKRDLAAILTSEPPPQATRPGIHPAPTLAGMPAIGRALMTQLGLLILDEPGHRVLSDGRYLRRRGPHPRPRQHRAAGEQPLAEALEVADRAYALQTGGIVMSGLAAVITRATLLHGPAGGAWNWLGAGSSALTLEAHLAVQAEPEPPPPHSQAEAQGDELARV